MSCSLDGATRIVALRHGQTAWNVEQRIQGQLDIGLDGTGRWQAGRLAQALADDDIAAIHASDLTRAADTAAALGRAIGVAVVHDAALRERGFGAFEGLTFREIEQRYPEDARRWRARDPGFAPGGGETLLAFSARAVAAALRIAGLYPGRTIALVAHGGVLDCWYRAATGVALDAPRSWQLGNAAVNRLLCNGERLALVGWNDNRHLEPAA